MGRRFTLLITSLSVALFAALSPLASLAQPVPPPPAVYELQNELNSPPGLATPAGQVTVMVELGRPNAGAPLDQLHGRQTALLQNLASINAQPLFATTLTQQGLVVLAQANQLNQLRRMPGVTRVSIIPPKAPASASAAVAATSLPAVTSAIISATGAGVRIGVVDRGIDYTHADFGGLGTLAGYTANNPTTIEPGSFPTAKVIGGFDFAGDNYDASGATGSALPEPDADPLECNQPLVGTAPNQSNGEGSHVAGLAAGFGVAADNTPYRGPYGLGADYSSLKLAPGVAPEAQLYALKIFGCAGSSALLSAAIERSVDPNGDGNSADHLDVLLISVGTPFGSPDDPDAIAVDNAVRAGVVVVVAAGDTLNTFYSINSPASAMLAIAVGATNNGQTIASNSARGPLRGNQFLKPDLVAPGVDIRSAAVASGADAQIMSGSAIAATQVAGAAAVLRQLHASWTPAQIKAALLNSAQPIAAPPSLAGAGQLNIAGLGAAELLAYNADGSSGGLTYGAPWVAATSSATRTLQLENTSSTNRQVVLSSSTVASEDGVTLKLPAGPITVPANGSAQAIVELSIDASGLPFTPDSATQPLQNRSARHYLAEHGGYIQVNSLSGGSGTRVRAAHAAHFASVDFYIDNILLEHSLDSREVEDYLSIAPGSHTVEIRRDSSSPSAPVLFSAPVNLLDGRDYTLVLVGRPGALGIVTVDETALAPPAAGQAIIHFVNANLAEPGWNIGPLDVYLDGALRAAALGLGETSPYLEIAAGKHSVSFFRAGENPSAVRPLTTKSFVAVAGAAILAGTGRHDDNDGDLFDFEQRAFIGFGEPRFGATQLASIPFNVFPTVAADAHAAGTDFIGPGAASFAVGIRNNGARNAGMAGTAGTPRTPFASAFELEAASPPIAGLSPALRAADLQYVGITSSYSLTQNLDPDTLLFFGIAAHAPWSTPNEVQLLVYIDANQDGRDDFVLVNINSSARYDSAATDVFLNALYPLRPDGTIAAATRVAPWGSFTAPISSSINLAPFNTSVMFQTALVRDLALPIDPNNPQGAKGPAPQSFCYHVETRARDLGFFSQVLDRVPEATAAPLAACGNRSGVLLYDIPGAAIKPINSTSLVFGSPIAARPIFLDVDGGLISGGVNLAALQARGGAQLLIFHHHNAPFPQAEIADIQPQPLIQTAPNLVYMPFAFH